MLTIAETPFDAMISSRLPSDRSYLSPWRFMRLLNNRKIYGAVKIAR